MLNVYIVNIPSEIMPYKDRQKGLTYQRIYNKKHYSRRKQYYREKNKERRKETQIWLREYKKTLKCVKCFIQDFRCIDFNHKKKQDKLIDVSKMPSYGYSKETIMKEINKCEPMCRNCHAIHTYENKDFLYRKRVRNDSNIHPSA